MYMCVRREMYPCLLLFNVHSPQLIVFLCSAILQDVRDAGSFYFFITTVEAVI